MRGFISNLNCWASTRQRREESKGNIVQDFIAKIEKDTGKKVEKTASGLMYVTLREGAGASPKSTDTVEVHYTGWLLDGTKFDSSVDRGKPARFPLNGVIRGWTEGVGLMKVGEKRKLIIPPNLAYGERGAGRDIRANEALEFSVEVVDVKPYVEPAPADSTKVAEPAKK